MKITDFSVKGSDGRRIPADAHGNNLAFHCEGCGHPILAIARENQRGFDQDHPATCKKCGIKYFLKLSEKSNELSINKIIK